MDYVGFIHSSPKLSNYGRVSKKCLPIAPRATDEIVTVKLHQHHRQMSTVSDKKATMRRDILDAVMKRTESMLDDKEVDDNPMYEDPRDVIGEKPPKPPRKRNMQTTGATSPKSKDGKLTLREQKKKLTKKYEALITALIDRCEDNVLQLSEKDSHISKLKDKLKTVLEYNKLFAEENDQLKHQHGMLVNYVEECKAVVREEKEKSKELEERCREMEERVKRFEVPDREHAEPLTAIPLVEVCMSCSSRQIILNQARDQNSRLQKDMLALKDVLYRLNVQLSRYQEKIRSNVQTLTIDKEPIQKPVERYQAAGDALDSLISASLGYKGQDAGNTEDGHSRSVHEEPTHTRVADLSGLLSAQALAPLFDAYQDNLQEKDSLILDYEKQFENMNKKSKQIVSENKSLSEKLSALEGELTQLRQNYKKLVVEKETSDIERATLLERAERAEAKLKDVYEMYEDKMAAMMRDYETVHREYFTVKSVLEATEGKVSQLDVLRARTVPADLHERRLEHCKRLLEELKHHYKMDTERKTEHIKKLEEQLKPLQEKYEKLCQEHQTIQEELKVARRNAKLYRKAATIFRARVRAATARVTRVRRSARAARNNTEPLRQALDTLERIKGEIKLVKSKAHTSLEELERRIVAQERRAAHAHAEYRRELERASVALEHKESIIASLIDKVADVEEVRLSQTNAHRLQGIVSDTDSSSTKVSDGKNQKKDSKIKLVQGSGGYYQDRDSKKRGK